MREEHGLDKVPEEKGGTISPDTFRRLFLLSVIANFKRGSYGLKRLHKVTYIVERSQKMKLRPFEFKKYHHGQYSETLDEIINQLITLGLVIATPLDTTIRTIFRLPDGKTIEWLEGGTRFTVSDPEAIAFVTRAFATIMPEGIAAVRYAVRTFGYLPESELLDRCYALPEFNKASFEEIIFDSNLPDEIEVPNLSEDECEELEMALNPKFISAMKKIVEGMEKSKLDLKRVKEVGAPV